MAEGSPFNYSAFLGTRLLLSTFSALPRRLALAAAFSMAGLVCRLDRRHRRIADVNLRIAFPELSLQERQRLTADSFRSLARLAVEISRIHRLNAENIRRVAIYDEKLGLDNYLSAKAKGQGVLFLTGHFSSWELLPVAHALYGYPLSFVVRPLDNPRLDHLIDSRRRLCGNLTLMKRQSMRGILGTLADGGDVGILIDQNVLPGEGAFVPFFGKPACTTTGMARLAQKTKAPVIPGRIRWCPEDEIYRILFWPELQLVDTRDKEQDILANTALFNRALEEMVRVEPGDWLWGHKRWNTRPPEDPENPYAPSDAW